MLLRFAGRLFNERILMKHTHIHYMHCLLLTLSLLLLPLLESIDFLTRPRPYIFAYVSYKIAVILTQRSYDAWNENYFNIWKLRTSWFLNVTCDTRNHNANNYGNCQKITTSHYTNKLSSIASFVYLLFVPSVKFKNYWKFYVELLHSSWAQLSQQFSQFEMVGTHWPNERCHIRWRSVNETKKFAQNFTLNLWYLFLTKMRNSWPQ